MLDSVEVTARVGEILTAHKGMEGPLLPILHAIQHEFGYVPQAALPVIASDGTVTGPTGKKAGVVSARAASGRSR